MEPGQTQHRLYTENWETLNLPEGVLVKNPFKPTAGARPQLLLERNDIRQDFAESIENGPGRHHRRTK